MGGSTPFGEGTSTPDPLAQFLGLVVPWKPDCYVNIHAFGGSTSLPFRGGGHAYASMDEYGEISGFVSYLNRIEAEVFFCLSSQSLCGENNGRYRKAIRKRENARWLKALVLDLDVKDTGYPSQEAALAALLRFCDDLKLEPTIVDSGRGIHGYIVLDQPILRKDWQPLADRLAYAAQSKGLKCDIGVTRNPATLLRLPTSFNRKKDPLGCKVL